MSRTPSRAARAAPWSGRISLPFHIHSQPDDTTCGPTCLDAVYRFYGEDSSLERVIAETGTLAGGGTLAAFLACHALDRGYRASVYTFNLTLFDPTWFREDVDLREKLEIQLRRKSSEKLAVATEAYIDFLRLGGKLYYEDLTHELIRRHLEREVPILTGLSATYLYGTPRECGKTNDYDDVSGHAAGHFVVLCGYDPETHEVTVADPLLPNPVSDSQYYQVGLPRLIGAIYLGVLTYDANLLVLEPG